MPHIDRLTAEAIAARIDVRDLIRWCELTYARSEDISEKARCNRMAQCLRDLQNLKRENLLLRSVVDSVDDAIGYWRNNNADDAKGGEDAAR